MDDDDFLSELGITNRKPSPVNASGTNGKAASAPPPSASKTAATPMAIRAPSGGGVSINTDLTKKKKKQPTKSQSDQPDDFQQFLAASPRDASALTASKKSKDVPLALALDDDDTTFSPASAADRFQLYANAFEFADDDFSMVLEEEQPFLQIAKSKMKEDVANRFIASWKQTCGGNLSDARLTNRSVSFLSALILFHDPKLWAFLASKKFDFARPSLFEFYAPTDGQTAPLFELWDASILEALPGFETPTQGSIMFAVGLFLCNRDSIISCTGDLDALVDGFRNSASLVQAVIVGARAAKLTSEYFLRLVGEPELDWNQYDKLLTTEDKRSPASPPPTTLQRRETAQLKRQDSNKSEGQTSSAVASMSSWMGSLKASTANLTTATIKEGFSSLSLKMSEALQGSIDEEDNPTPRHQVRKRTASESRHLFIVEYPGVRRLGLQLGQTASSGLAVLGFDTSQQVPGEAEKDGTVQIGDAMHSVNWVSVSCLPASIAGKVLAKQERPLHITFSTANVQGRKLPTGLSIEGKSMQHALLKSRLLSFYSRFGASKLDDISSILRIYAKHEKSLVRGLYHKYGEPIPGDGSFTSEFVLVSAAEALTGGLTRRADDEPDPDDLIFVDVRTKEERADTGILPSTFCLSFDDKDEKVMKGIARGVTLKSNRTKICLLASGTYRMFSLVDPARAAEEKGKDDRRLLMAARKLSSAGMNCICAIRGGFAECFREAAVRAVPFGPEVLADCGQGYLYKACQAYALVDLKDTESLGRFIVGYFTDFKEPVLPFDAAAEEAAANGSSTQAPPVVGRSVSQEGMQNLQAAFSTLVPAKLPGVTVPNLFNKGVPVKGENSKDKNISAAASNQPSATSTESFGFTIEDD